MYLFIYCFKYSPSGIPTADLGSRMSLACDNDSVTIKKANDMKCYQIWPEKSLNNNAAASLIHQQMSLMSRFTFSPSL